jgi:hypothetical protein
LPRRLTRLSEKVAASDEIGWPDVCLSFRTVKGSSPKAVPTFYSQARPVSVVFFQPPLTCPGGKPEPRKVRMSHWIGTTSPSDAGMNDFKECLKNLRDGQSEDALQHARRALGIAPKNPFYLSYTGLLAALAEKRFGDAESLCREALGMKHNHAQLYLNLAEVYYQAGRTTDAITTLEKGLISAGRDFRIRRALEKIGVRRMPVLTFLHRSHPVNRTLGKWRQRLTGPPKAA